MTEATDESDVRRMTEIPLIIASKTGIYHSDQPDAPMEITSLYSHQSIRSRKPSCWSSLRRLGYPAVLVPVQYPSLRQRRWEIVTGGDNQSSRS